MINRWNNGTERARMSKPKRKQNNAHSHTHSSSAPNKSRRKTNATIAAQRLWENEPLHHIHRHTQAPSRIHTEKKRWEKERLKWAKSERRPHSITCLIQRPYDSFTPCQSLVNCGTNRTYTFFVLRLFICFIYVEFVFVLFRNWHNNAHTPKRIHLIYSIMFWLKYFFSAFRMEIDEKRKTTVTKNKR